MYIFFYALAILIGGTDAAITKRFLLGSFSPSEVVVFRFIVATICLAPFAVGDRKMLKGLNRRDWLYLAFLAVIGTVVINLLYFQSLVFIPSFVVVMLYRVEPVFIIILAAVFLHQPASKRTWLLTLAAIACSALVAAGNTSQAEFTSQAGLGVALILLASFFYAISTLLGKRMLSKLSPILLIWLRMAIAALILIAFFAPDLVKIIPTLTLQDVIVLVILGAFHSGVSNWFFYKGLQFSTPLFGGLIQLLGPVSGIIASFFLMNEQPNLIQMAGIAGLFFVLFLLARPEKLKAPE